MNTKLILLMSLLIITSCGGNKAASDPHADVVTQNLDIFTNGKVLLAANSSSPYASAMLDCALDKSGENCSPKKLPFIGMANQNITPQSILDRTLVSHSFMATTFKKFLEDLANDDLLYMFSSVSGVVLTDEISSSFYTIRTGMIYINANFLWKDEKEKSLLTFKEDTRGSSAPRKDFEMSHFYQKNGKRYNAGLYSTTRTQDDISELLTRVLYHELAHSMDYFPPKENIEILDSNETYIDLAYKKYDNSNSASDLLGYAKGDEVYFYANYYFYDELIEDKIPEMDTYIFMRDFKPSNAIAFYSYTSNKEHLAMLIEAYMMIHINGYDECTRAYEKTEDSWAQFWGQKNRVLQDSVYTEAKNAINLIFNSKRSERLNNIVTNKTEEDSTTGVQYSNFCF